MHRFVQDIPLNIAAVGEQQIAEQGFDELADVLAYVPGINIVDRGGRQDRREVLGQQEEQGDTAQHDADESDAHDGVMEERQCIERESPDPR